MELSILQAIQSAAHPVLDALFIGLTLLGEPLAAVAVITVFYWLLDKEGGEYLTFGLLFSLGLNGAVKNLCNFPRPIGQEGIRSLRVETATGASFPSGHTQTAGTLYPSLAFRLRRRWIWLPALLLPLLVAFSRLYLGVHWPKDVLAGFALGLGCSSLAYFIYCNVNEKGRELLTLGLAVLLLPLVLLWPEEDFVKAYGLLAGFALAIPLEHRFVRFSTDWYSRKRPFLRELLGLLILGAVKTGTSLLLPELPFLVAMEYGLISFFAFFICPLCFVKLRI